jgi:hypothetical protein
MPTYLQIAWHGASIAWQSWTLLVDSGILAPRVLNDH